MGNEKIKLEFSPLFDSLTKREVEDHLFYYDSALRLDEAERGDLVDRLYNRLISEASTNGIAENAGLICMYTDEGFVFQKS